MRTPQLLPPVIVNPNLNPVVKPSVLSSPFVGSDDQITVTWNAVGCKINRIVGLPFTITIQDGGLSATGSYPSPATPPDPQWSYTVYYQVGEDEFRHDPEIDNIRP